MLGAPAELLTYCHQELLLVIPWSGLIGLRRFNQGILIRNGKSAKVTIGTIIRMVSMLGSLVFFLIFKNRFTGAQAAGFSLTFCVALESLYNEIEGRKVARTAVIPVETDEPLITWKELIAFVIPLILTTFMNNICNDLKNPKLNRFKEFFL